MEHPSLPKSIYKKTIKAKKVCSISTLTAVYKKNKVETIVKYKETRKLIKSINNISKNLMLCGYIKMSLYSYANI